MVVLMVLIQVVRTDRVVYNSCRHQQQQHLFILVERYEQLDLGGFLAGFLGGVHSKQATFFSL
jgi:hypothetical protein